MSIAKSCLLLNASFEPIGLIGIERAICLNYLDKVYVEEYQEDKVYRSQNQIIKIPSVVRLKHYINIRKKRRDSSTKRNRIYIRDKFRCSYCGEKGNSRDLTLDHIIPKCRGGENIPENLVTCCFRCNQKKRDSSLEECGMILLHTPKQLKVGLDKWILNHYAEVRPSWGKFLFADSQSLGDSRYSHSE